MKQDSLFIAHISVALSECSFEILNIFHNSMDFHLGWWSNLCQASFCLFVIMFNLLDGESLSYQEWTDK